jgi:hypothetical protein
MPPDGGGRGHFTTLAEMRAAILDHDRRISLMERALYSALTAEAVREARPKRRRRPKSE